MVDAGRADRRHPQAARAHRPAGDAAASPGAGGAGAGAGGHRSGGARDAPGARRRRRRGRGTEHDSCRVGSLAVSEPVTVHAIWESACRSYNGGNNRGGGIDFAGFAPAAVREKTCLILNTIGPDRADTMREMLGHLAAAGSSTPRASSSTRRRCSDAARRVPAAGARALRRTRTAGGAPSCARTRATSTLFFVELEPEVLERYGRALVASAHWLQRRTKYGDIADDVLSVARGSRDAPARPAGGSSRASASPSSSPTCARSTSPRSPTCSTRATTAPTRPAGGRRRPASTRRKRRGFVVSMGEDLGAIKISGWTHTIPEYFDFDRFWAGYPGAARARRRRGHGEGADAPHRRAPRARVGHAPPLSHQLARDRRRGARQSRRRASVQGLQRAAHAQRRAGGRRLDLAVPERVRLRARRPVDGRGRRRLPRRLGLRAQGAHRHRVRRLPGRLHAPRARAHHRGGDPDHLADHRARPRGDGRRAPREASSC